MENKKATTLDFLLSIKRIEYILEEMLWRQILHNAEDENSARAELKRALENISNDLKEFVSNLPPL